MYVCKCKCSIEHGRTTLLDMEGNNGADELALAGASAHQFPSEVVTVAHERRDWAVHVQQMMVGTESMMRSTAEMLS